MFWLMTKVPKWVITESILMVTISGLLTRLYCPFRVECLQDVDELRKGMVYRVDRVGFVGGEICHEIKGKYRSYRWFKLL